MTNLEHLSYSSISSWLYCARNWKFKYIDKIPTATSPELITGSAFHGTIEQFLSNDKKGSLSDIWLSNWAKQLENNQVDWGLDTPESFCNEGIRLLNHESIINGILSIVPGRDDQGMKMERKVELKVPGVPIPIIGYIDMIDEAGTPCDFKTSKSSWSTDKALAEVQPLFYLAALNQMGIQTPGWRFKHYIFVKTKTPQFQAIEHVHNPGQLMWLFEMIKSVWQAIEAGHFPPNPTGWMCSPNYCNFWSICRGRN